jgi:hypothetical protein
MSLQLDALELGNYQYLNEIAQAWREGKSQARTPVSGERTVMIRLRDSEHGTFSIVFPDVSGESYREMWEARQCSTTITSQLQRRTGTLLFIHADTIEQPRWIVDETVLSQRLGIPVDGDHPAEWSPRLAPTQAQLVDNLQLLAGPVLSSGMGRLAVLLSAWDTVSDEGLTPAAFLATRLPLLDQYLREGADGWTYKLWGVSAQGGEYENPEKPFAAGERAGLDRILSLDRPIDRITVVSEHAESRDLTEPIAWLLGRD